MSTITRTFDILFVPLSHFSPWVGMVGVSLLSGVMLLVIFRYTSNQRGLRAVKNQLVAHLLEVVLYRDELPVVLRAQARLVRDNLRYLSYALVPLVCMVLPVAVLLVQIDLRYGHRPLQVGERAIVAVKLQPAAGSLDSVSLLAPPGVTVETPALRIEDGREVDWRVVARQPGSYDLRLSAGGQHFTKTLAAGPQVSRVSGERGRGLRERFLQPGEAPLPAGAPVDWVRVSYPESALRLFGWRIAWIWAWLVLSMVFGYALRGPLRVQV